MRSRKEILTDLVKNKRDVATLTQELSLLPWDTDEILCTITANDVGRAIDTLAPEVIEDWADAVELRDGLDFENAKVKEIVHELANQSLFATMSPERSKSLKKRLRMSRES